jgi:hypothetical protein
VRGAIDAIRNPMDEQAQLQQEANHERADEERDNSRDQVDQSLRRGLLIAEHDAGHDGDPAEKDGDDVEQLYKAAKERMTKGEIKKSCEKILLIGHAASSKEFRSASWTETLVRRKGDISQGALLAGEGLPPAGEAAKRFGAP